MGASFDGPEEVETAGENRRDIRLVAGDSVEARDSVATRSQATDAGIGSPLGVRVLFTTTSGRGHFQPMLPLARALAHAGHEVRWAGAEQELRGRGFDAVPAGIFEVVPAPLRNPLPEIAALPPAERPDQLFALGFGPLRAQPMLADLMPIVEGWRPHLLVCEQGELAGPIAAARHDVPNNDPRVRTAAPGGARGPCPRVDARPLARARPRAAALRGHLRPPLRRHLPAEPADRRHRTPPRRPARASSRAGRAGRCGRAARVRHARDRLQRRPPALLDRGRGGACARHPRRRHGRTGKRPRRPRPTAVTRDRRAVHSPGGVAARLRGRRLARGLGDVSRRARRRRAPGAAAAGRRPVPHRRGGAQGGIAIAVPRAEVSIERVREALERVLGDGAFRAAAERVRTEISAMPAPEAVVAELERRYAPVT
jgi:hypothetical protein